MSTRKFVASFLVFLAAALAAPLASAAGSKVGFVNMKEIMAQAPQAEAAQAQLKQEFGGREKALAAQRDAIQKQEADLKRDAAVMSATKKSQAEKSLRDKVSAFTRDMNAFRDALNTKRNELLQGLLKQIQAAVTKVAKAGGYDVVLNNAVVYVNPKVDLTKQVLAELAKSKD
jgi:outer membrane protein